MSSETNFILAIRDILDGVAAQHLEVPLADPLWARTISSRIAEAVKGLGRRSFATGQPLHCDGPEWLFDYCLIQVDEGTHPTDDVLGTHLLIAGEIELNPGNIHIYRDFQKILVADSQFGFFICQTGNEPAAQAVLELLARTAESRRSRARDSGLREPPTYLISCFVWGTHRFLHREVP